MPQCDETRFSTIQPSIYVTGIRNERWQWWKNDVVILVALIACIKFGDIIVYYNRMDSSTSVNHDY